MKTHVVILGGGFAGVQAAITLQGSRMSNVTLVCDRDHLYLYPTSIWVPTRERKFEQTKIPLADIQRAHGFGIRISNVVGISIATRMVITSSGGLSYDYLIIALGAEEVLLPGQEHTLSLCGDPEQSLEIRDQLDRLNAAGSGRIAIGFGGNPKDKSAVRGGPAFEFLFNVEHLLKRKGLRSSFVLSFFAPMASPGERMGKRAVAMIDSMFRSMGIEKRYGTKIRSFRPGRVEFEDGSALDADLVMFIPGNAGHRAVKTSDLPLSDAGFVLIDDQTLVAGTTNVFAVGDVAALDGPEWKAKQGHLAEVMARVAALNIIIAELGEQQSEGYQKHLSILCIMDTGSGAAVVYRNAQREVVVPLPILGHWAKRAWALYGACRKLASSPTAVLDGHTGRWPIEQLEFRGTDSGTLGESMWRQSIPRCKR